MKEMKRVEKISWFGLELRTDEPKQKGRNMTILGLQQIINKQSWPRSLTNISLRVDNHLSRKSGRSTSHQGDVKLQTSKDWSTYCNSKFHLVDITWYGITKRHSILEGCQPTKKMILHPEIPQNRNDFTSSSIYIL